MCEIKHGHDYSEDAGAEMATDDRVDLNGFLEHLKGLWWLLLPLLLWVVRVEMRLGPDGFSAKDAQIMEQRIEDKIDELPPDLYRTQMDQRFGALDRQLDRMESKIDSNGEAMLRHVENHNQ